MNKRKIKNIVYQYFEQYNSEYYKTPQINNIVITTDTNTWGEFDANLIHKKQYVLTINSKLFKEKETFVKQTLYHEFTHMYDSLCFLNHDEKSFRELMHIYSETHASEVEMDVILSTKTEDIITAQESMTLNKYMNDCLHSLEKQVIASNQTEFDYRQIYYFVGKLISLKKHDIPYNFELSPELPECFTTLFKEIINYFLNNTEYDDTSLLLFEQRMISALEDYITSSIPNFDFRSELNKIDTSGLLVDIFDRFNQDK